MNYLIIILLISIQFIGKAQNLTDAVVSDNLLSLEMLCWKTPGDSGKAAVLLEKAQLYKACGMYAEALKELGRAEKYMLNNSLKTYINYEKLLNHFLNRDYGYCTDIVIETKDISDIGRQKEYTLMRLQALAETERWHQCKEELMAANCCNDSTFIQHVHQLPEHYSYISPEECKRLSSFFPGLGAIKAGYPVKGITSFVLQAGLIAFTGYNFYYGYYVTGSVSGIVPFLKFYSGGKRLSERLAEKHNQKEKGKLKADYSVLINQAVNK